MIGMLTLRISGVGYDFKIFRVIRVDLIERRITICIELAVNISPGIVFSLACTRPCLQQDPAERRSRQFASGALHVCEIEHVCEDFEIVGFRQGSRRIGGHRLARDFKHLACRAVGPVIADAPVDFDRGMATGAIDVRHR
jgi:hypothetical protein